MKLIDWSAMPRGTMTNLGELLYTKWIQDKLYAGLIDDTDFREIAVSVLRIVPATRWTYHDGGECSIPDGVICESMWGEITRPAYETIRGAHSWDKIIAYRITGVDSAGGFTDDPYEATE